MNQQREFDLTVPPEPADHVIGASHAPVTVVEYGDFECPNCKQAAPAVKLLLERFAGRVQVIFRQNISDEKNEVARILCAELDARVSEALIRKS